MAATHSTLHFASGSSLKVVETVADIMAMHPPPAWPAGVTVTNGAGAKLWVSLACVEWIEPA